MLSLLVLAAVPTRADERMIDLAPDRLVRAIADLSLQTQVEILLQAPGREDEPTPAIQGRMSIERALKELVKGKGLSVRRLGPRLYLIEIRQRQPHPRRPASTLTTSGPDILVTARRRPERGNDVPLAISQVGVDALSQYAIGNLADLAHMVPGFVATGQGSSATPLLVMRGQRRGFADENRLPLVVYVDEVPLPNQAALSPLFDVASVEVLRGPQGTLFGRNTTAGAVLVHSAMPGAESSSYIEHDVGNFGLHRLEGAMEVSPASWIAIRLSGRRERRDGFFRLESGARIDNAHSDAARAIVRLTPLERLRSISSIELLNGDETGSAQILLGTYAGGNARTDENAPYFDCGQGTCDVDYFLVRQRQLGRQVSQSGLPPRFVRRFRSLSNITEYGDSDFMLRNILGWRSVRVATAVDGDATPLPINDTVSRTNLRQWSEEFQIQGRSDKLRYIAGIFHLDTAPNGPMLQYAAQFARPDNPPTNIANYETLRSTALFGQLSLALGHGRSADVGLRYTSETVSGCWMRSPVLAPTSAAECERVGGSLAHTRSGQLTWTAALSQRLGDFNLYVTTRRAFRSGGYNNPALGDALGRFQTFRPETLTDVEAGVKGDVASGVLTGHVSLAAYVGFYGNIQRALFPPPGFDGDDDSTNDPNTLFVNLARARISGLDAELSLSIGAHTRASFSASFVDADYMHVDVPAILEPLLGTEPRSNRFSYSPRFSGAVQLTHDIPLPRDLGMIELGFNYSRNGSIRYAERRNDPFARQPGYDLLDGWIGWRQVGGSALDLELWGRNLTDTRYASGGVMLNPTFTVATVMPAPPRTMGLRIRYSFD